VQRLATPTLQPVVYSFSLPELAPTRNPVTDTDPANCPRALRQLRRFTDADSPACNAVPTVKQLLPVAGTIPTRLEALQALLTEKNSRRVSFLREGDDPAAPMHASATGSKNHHSDRSVEFPGASLRTDIPARGRGPRPPALNTNALSAALANSTCCRSTSRGYLKPR